MADARSARGDRVDHRDAVTTRNMPGHVDVLDHFEVSGWSVAGLHAHDRVVILADSTELATVPADRVRNDVAEVGVREGRCGFKFLFPETPGIFQPVEIEVRSAVTGQLLPDGKRTLQPLLFGDGPYRHSLDRRCEALIPTGMRRRDHGITVSARAVAPPEAQVTVRRLRPDGRISEASPAEVDVRPEPVSDLPAGSPIFRNITWQLDARSCDDSDYVLFRMVDADKVFGADRAAEQEPPDHTQPDYTQPDYTQAVCTACVPLRTEWFTSPGEEGAMRTFGSYDTDLLMIASATHAYKIDVVTRNLFAGRRDLRILDWGMGFGRIAMAIKRVFNPEAHISGYDIDRFNVDWARTNLPDIPAGHCDFYPPLPLPSDAIDFIYGFSVMTHLTEAAQEIWLRELRRVLKPGGACLLTTRSDHLLREQGVRTPAILQQLATYGLSDISRDTNLGPKLENKTYYRGTIQLREQIERTWSRYFDIVAYLPFGFRQDAVIMRKS